MPRGLFRMLALLCLALPPAACGNEEDDRLDAEPADTIAPAPKDTAIVPGADEPGPQVEP